MGRDKALLPWHGRTFLTAQIQALSLHTDFVLVVAGANSAELEPVTDANGVRKQTKLILIYYA
jgi:molybdopterin-guanine dinucleotide biosynthesis protein A